jgi:hypothetical protein
MKIYFEDKRKLKNIENEKKAGEHEFRTFDSENEYRTEQMKKCENQFSTMKSFEIIF